MTRIALNTYRLRKLAMGMTIFTTADLAAAAGVTVQTAYDFVGKLRETNPEFLLEEELKPLGPGRRVKRYTLTRGGYEYLVEENAPIAREINKEALSADPDLQLVTEKAPASGGLIRLIPDPRSPAYASLSPQASPSWQEWRRAAPAAASASPTTSWNDRVGSWLSRVLPDYSSSFVEGATSLLIRAGQPAAARFGSQVRPTAEGSVWSPDEIQSSLHEIFNTMQRERLEQQGWTAYSFDAGNNQPLEISARLSVGQPVIELRPLSARVPSIEQMHLPQLVGKLAARGKGLILVTGLARTGKSGAIAAMIGDINVNRTEHITTIDEPIHYFYAKGRSFIEQKQIAIDTPNFSTALDRALASGSQVITLSDVPDRDAFSTVLAGAGRALIFCRVSAPSPADAIRKLIHLAPEAEQPELRERLARSLSGIIYRGSRIGSAGQVIETEVLGLTSTIHETILDPEQTRFLVDRAKAAGSFESTEARAEDPSIVDSRVTSHWTSGFIR